MAGAWLVLMVVGREVVGCFVVSIHHRYHSERNRGSFSFSFAHPFHHTTLPLLYTNPPKTHRLPAAPLLRGRAIPPRIPLAPHAALPLVPRPAAGGGTAEGGSRERRDGGGGYGGLVIGGDLGWGWGDDDGRASEKHYTYWLGSNKKEAEQIRVARDATAILKY